MKSLDKLVNEIQGRLISSDAWIFETQSYNTYTTVSSTQEDVFTVSGKPIESSCDIFWRNIIRQQFWLTTKREN